MRVVVLLVLLAALVVVPAGPAQLEPGEAATDTQALLIHYRAHDGVLRPAVLLLPVGYAGQPIPLVISPHGRGLGPWANARFWGDLPGLGDFAVINPGGEGRVLHSYSWGAPGQISDLGRMPVIAEAAGVNVDPHRIYAVGGSMGGQETLLLVAHDPHPLAGAIAFDPDTNMALRYRDFAALRDGRTLQELARIEIGGTPEQVPRAYALRSPEDDAVQIADSGVPLQIYWSSRDRIIRDQRREAGLLAQQILDDHPDEHVWDFEGEWSHTAEMQSDRRLPRALARFGLLPWSDVPSLVAAPSSSTL